MKVAVIPPYYFPYVGYFEVVKAVDKFVFFDTAVYPTSGWVNRNRVFSRLESKEWQYLTIPTVKVEPGTPINKVEVTDRYWSNQHIRQLYAIYGKKAVEVFTEMLIYFTEFQFFGERKVADFAANSVISTSSYLGVADRDKWEWASALPKTVTDPSLTAVEQVIDICRHFGADTCVAIPSSKRLYKESMFEEAGLKLEFPKSDFDNDLSIIDVCVREGLEYL